MSYFNLDTVDVKSGFFSHEQFVMFCYGLKCYRIDLVEFKSESFDANAYITKHPETFLFMIKKAYPKHENLESAKLYVYIILSSSIDLRLSLLIMLSIKLLVHRLIL